MALECLFLFIFPESEAWVGHVVWTLYRSETLRVHFQDLDASHVSLMFNIKRIKAPRTMYCTTPCVTIMTGQCIVPSLLLNTQP